MPPDANIIDPGYPVAGPVSQALQAPIEATAPNQPAAVSAKEVAAKSEQDAFTGLWSNISAVTSKLSDAYNAGKAAAGAAAGAAEEAVGLGNSAATAVKAEGKTTASIAYNDAQAAAQRDADTAAFAVRAHLGVNDPQVVQAAADMAEGTRQAYTEASNLLKYNQVKFFDNPAQYLINHVINIPGAQDRLENAVTAVNSTKEGLDASAKAIADRSVIDASLHSANTIQRAGLVSQQAVQAATVASYQPLMQAQQLKQGALHLGIDAANAQTAALGTATQAYSAQGHLIGEKAQSEFYSQAKEASINEQQQKAAYYKEMITEKQATTERQQAGLTLANNLLHGLGAPQGITSLETLDPKKRDVLGTMAANYAASGSLGAGPAEAVTNFNKLGVNFNMPPSQMAVKDQLDSIIQQTVQEQAAKRADGTELRGDALETAVNQAVSMKLKNFQSNITPQTPIFGTHSLDTMLAQPWAQKNPVLQGLAPLAADASGKLQPTQFKFENAFDMANKLIADKKINVNQAVQALKDIAANDQNDNNVAGGFKLWNIPLLQKYQIQMHPFGINIFGNRQSVDLFNPAQIADTLLTRQAQMKTQSAIDSGSIAIPGPAPVPTAGGF